MPSLLEMRMRSIVISERDLVQCRFRLKNNMSSFISTYQKKYNKLPLNIKELKNYYIYNKDKMRCPAILLSEKENHRVYLLYYNLSQNYKDKLKLKGIDKNKEIWVIDKPGNHPSNKINVLYSDGTVQTVEYELKK